MPATIAVIAVARPLRDDGDATHGLRLRKFVLDPASFSPAFGIGSLVVFSRSPSSSMAASSVPPLAVIFGCSDSSGTSLAGLR